jgi:hypothetical protein
MLMPSNCSKALAALLLLWPLTATAGKELLILKRESWKAKPAIGELKQHQPVAILVHHTGSTAKIKTELAQKMRGLQRFSQNKEKLADGRMKPAWPDVPYHFYIAVDGKIAEGRNINAVGDTNTAYDPTGFIQVVVEGNFETETVHEAQADSLRLLLQHLKDRYSLTQSDILAHNAKAQTACPGKDLAKRLPKIVEALR